MATPRSTTSEQGVRVTTSAEATPWGCEAGHLATHLASAEQGKHRLRPVLADAAHLHQAGAQQKQPLRLLLLQNQLLVFLQHHQPMVVEQSPPLLLRQSREEGHFSELHGMQRLGPQSMPVEMRHLRTSP